jgi:hypothetical protein
MPSRAPKLLLICNSHLTVLNVGQTLVYEGYLLSDYLKALVAGNRKNYVRTIMTAMISEASELQLVSEAGPNHNGDPAKNESQ